MRRLTAIAVSLVAALVAVSGLAFTAGGSATAAEDDASLVEDFSYPGAAAIESSRRIKLISGDGRITLLKDCTTSEPKIQIETFASDSERYYCFKVKGDKGLLKLEMPSVYLVFAGDEKLNAKYTVDGEAGSVNIKPNGVEGIGSDDPDNGAVLLELRAGN
jgi:hypothetical protein